MSAKHTEKKSNKNLEDEIKELQKKRKSFKKKLEQISSELKQREAELSSILESATAVLEKTTFKEAAQKIFEMCKNLLGGNSGYVALLSRDGEENEFCSLTKGLMTAL